MTEKEIQFNFNREEVIKILHNELGRDLSNKKDKVIKYRSLLSFGVTIICALFLHYKPYNIGGNTTCISILAYCFFASLVYSKSQLGEYFDRKELKKRYNALDMFKK